MRHPWQFRFLVILGLLASGGFWSVAAADEHVVKQLILPGESFLVEGRPAFIFTGGIATLDFLRSHTRRIARRS